jgi:hypothetical protein
VTSLVLGDGYLGWTTRAASYQASLASLAAVTAHGGLLAAGEFVFAQVPRPPGTSAARSSVPVSGAVLAGLRCAAQPGTRNS